MTDITELTEQLKQSRGKEYYARLEYIFRLIGDDIKSDVAAFREAYGKLTPVDMGIIVQKYNLNYKAVCEYLEAERIIPAGMYQYLIDSGMKVKEVMAAVPARLEVIMADHESKADA